MTVQNREIFLCFITYNLFQSDTLPNAVYIAYAILQVSEKEF